MAKGKDPHDLGMQLTLPGHDEAGPPARRRGRIGRFEVRRTLGEGGMGVVYGAFDPELQRPVAIKLLHAALARNELHASRLQREAQAMARLSHPNVIRVYDVGTDGGQIFVAMELVEGHNVRQWLEKPRSYQEILAVYGAAGRGLAAAHAAGLVHRDFKPDNVLVAADGAVSVTDFGLVATAGEAPTPLPRLPERPDASGRATRLTLSGALIGTPAYMAPEQLECRPADARADQFSFCVSLYEALYRERPFAGDTIGDLSEAVAAGRIRPAPEGSRVPARVRAALLRGLAIDRAERFPSMDALLEALHPERRRGARRLVVASAIALGACLLALVVDLTARSRGDDQARAQLAGARQRLAHALNERQLAFQAAADLSYVTPVVREAMGQRNDADFGLGNKADGRAGLRDLHDQLEDADWKPLSDAMRNGPLALVDARGRLLWSSGAPAAFGNDTTALAPVVRAFEETGAAVATIRGDAPALRASGLVDTALPGLWILAARAAVLADVPRLAFVQVLEVRRILADVTGSTGLAAAALTPDGQLEGTLGPDAWVSDAVPLVWPDAAEPLATVVIRHPPGEGLFRGSRPILLAGSGLALLALALALFAVRSGSR